MRKEPHKVRLRHKNKPKLPSINDLLTTEWETKAHTYSMLLHQECLERPMPTMNSHLSRLVCDCGWFRQLTVTSILWTNPCETGKTCYQGEYVNSPASLFRSTNKQRHKKNLKPQLPNNWFTELELSLKSGYCPVVTYKVLHSRNDIY